MRMVNISIYQSLATIAKEFQNIPPSSATVKRLFSIAGEVFIPARYRLKDERFNSLCSLDVTVQ